MSPHLKIHQFTLIGEQFSQKGVVERKNLLDPFIRGSNRTFYNNQLQNINQIYRDKLDKKLYVLYTQVSKEGSSVGQHDHSK